jgi:alpha-glucosidase (family GH31 glycosyl hydrolase)
MKMINQRNRDTGIPLDVQYADIDYMDAAKVFTIDPINYKGLKEYFHQLNSDGIRIIYQLLKELKKMFLLNGKMGV